MSTRCDEVQPLLTRFLLRDLDEATAKEVGEHILSCERCRAAAQEIEPTLDRVRAALAARASATPRLDAAHRTRLLKSRHSTLARMERIGPVLVKVAAVLVVAFVLAGLLLPASHMARERAQLACRVAPCEVALPPQCMPLLEEAPQDVSGVVDGPVAGSPEPLTAGDRLSDLGRVDHRRSDAAAQAAGEGGGGQVAQREPAGRFYSVNAPSPLAGAGRVAEKAGEVLRKGADAARSAFTLSARLGEEAEETKAMMWAPASVAAADGNGMKDGWTPAADVRAFGGRAKEQAAAPHRGLAAGQPAEAPAPTTVALPADESVKELAHATGGEDTGATLFNGRTEGGRHQVILRSPTLQPRFKAIAGKGLGALGTGDSYSESRAKSTPEDRESLDVLAPLPPTPAGGPEALPSAVAESTLALPAKEVEAAALDLPAEKKSEDRTYVVKKGDTLSKIATEYDVDADQLAQLNAIADKDRIVAGQKIVLPPASAETAAPEITFQIVTDGEVAKRLPPPAVKPPPPPSEPERGVRFRAVGVNPFVDTAQNAFSTFSMDVDTASYSLARNYMIGGQLPPPEAVRTEEFINYFDYAYPPPLNRAFAVRTEVAPTPFGRGLHLLQIGVKGRQIGREGKRGAVLTFLIDTSGSMSTPDRLGLVKQSLRLLVERLAPADTVAIVAYDSHARLVLEHTPASDRRRILDAIEGLQPSGSTNLEEGMRLAYEIAARGFGPGRMNRVLLLSDGVANLGTVAADEILKRVESFRKQRIYCSVYGFGMGTYDDELLSTLANKGDGTYAFVDSPAEARRVFVDELAATLNVVASDAKIQVEFNPARVKQYRQIGYEKRQLTQEQFRDDTVDAGEVGSGQSVTALYEVELQGTAGDPLGIVRVRYRDAETGMIEETSQPIRSDGMPIQFEDASVGFRLAASVAEFAELLRGSPFAAAGRFEDAARALRPVALALSLDRRVQELLRLVQSAGSLPQARE